LIPSTSDFTTEGRRFFTALKEVFHFLFLLRELPLLPLWQKKLNKNYALQTNAD